MQIGRLQIETADLIPIRNFYHSVFGLPVLEESADRITFRAGHTALAVGRAHRLLAGAYHFAFNIPENQFDAAVQWLRQRVPLIADKTGQDTFYHETWNAHSVYFHDPADNIVEFIARHDLPSASDHPFSGQRVLGVSEIGVASKEVPVESVRLAEQTLSSVFRGSQSDEFVAIGDENGLLIVVKSGREWFPDTGQKAEPVPLSVTVRVADKPLTLDFA